ncbi:MAG: hypothetical protein ABI556_02585 [Gemmatimonadales bacterium]
MSDTSERLAQIHHAYFEDDDGAARALKIFESWQGALSKLLRHHRTESISDNETWERDSFDYLFAYFSMVEVACLAGWLSGELPTAHVEMATRVLGDEDVKRYYEDHYPILLPQAHRRRVEGQGLESNVGAPDGAEALFEHFFTLSQPIETGAEVETFLWFLDGGSRGGADINDTIEALRTPTSFLEHASARPEDFADETLPPLSASIQGFLSFVEFAPRLLQLLQETAEFPMLQSAMWHYHGYWLQQMNQHMGSEVRRALTAIERWDFLPGHESDTWVTQVEEGDITRAKQKRALAQLSSGRYSYALVEGLLALSARTTFLSDSRQFNFDEEAAPAVPQDEPAEDLVRSEDEELMS